MTNLEITKRIELLRDVFAYSLMRKHCLSAGKRICLSQERAELLRLLEPGAFSVEPRYVIPDHLEKKVQEIAKTIKETNWIKPNYEPLLN